MSALKIFINDTITRLLENRISPALLRRMIFLNMRIYCHIFSDVQGIEKEVMKGSTTTISCVITGITETVTVAWRTATETVTGDKFNSVQGSHSDGTQTSTLTVDSTEVTEDKAYTCRVTSGSLPDSGHFDNTVNLNVFGARDF